MYRLLLLLLLQYSRASCSASDIQILAVLPNRTSAYLHQVHNGLELTASRLNLTLQIRNVQGVGSLEEVLSELIENPAQQQPEIYLMWPLAVDSSSSRSSVQDLLQLLWETQGIPILQLHQLPRHDWEWNHLIGFVGPNEESKAQYAAAIMTRALTSRHLRQANLVALGYPKSSQSNSYTVSMQVFQVAMSASSSNTNTSIRFLRRLSLPDDGSQPAYDAMLRLLDSLSDSGTEIHGIYCMDDTILMGAYQAIQDHPKYSIDNITLVGTSCNGARDLSTSGQQFGTTVEGPYLVGELAISTAAEYIATGRLQSPFIRFTPNPGITREDPWQDMVVEHLGNSYSVDALCTWSLTYQRVAGLQSVQNVQDVCTFISCTYVSESIRAAAFVLCGMTYSLAIFSMICLYQPLRYPRTNHASPSHAIYLLLIVMGTVITNTAIIFFAHRNDPQSTRETETTTKSLDNDCHAAPWFLVLGHMMTTGMLVARMRQVPQLQRLQQEQHEQQYEQRPVEQRPQHMQDFTPSGLTNIIIVTTSLMLVDIFVLSIWSLVDPLQWEYDASVWDDHGYIVEASGQCGVEHDWSLLFPLGIALFHVAVLLYGNRLSYQTRNSHNIIPGIRSIAVALFLSLQLLLLTGPSLVLVEFYNGSVSAAYFIKVLFVFLECMSVLLVVVVPRAYGYLGGDIARDNQVTSKEDGPTGGAEDCYGPTTILDVDRFQMDSDDAGTEIMHVVDAECEQQQPAPELAETYSDEKMNDPNNENGGSAKKNDTRSEETNTDINMQPTTVATGDERSINPFVEMDPNDHDLFFLGEELASMLRQGGELHRSY
jgi:DNA-binding LacI/PurR family transcriptional regulator